MLVPVHVEEIETTLSGGKCSSWSDESAETLLFPTRQLMVELECAVLALPGSYNHFRRQDQGELYQAM